MLTTFLDPRFADVKNLPLPQGAKFLTKSELSDVSILVTAILQVQRNPLSQSGIIKKNIATSHRWTD
jgi:hypothetical protein